VAHGFLLSQFASPAVNRRTDEWAGMAVPAAAVRAVRTTVGEDFPVLVKMNCVGLEPGGLSLDQSAAAARVLAGAGSDALEISGAEAARTGIRVPDEEAYFGSYARRIRQEVDVPIIYADYYFLESLIRRDTI
jgi:2,4-dienoyl-CoA reductase-like NADH-dependent reductase (Old Yellow Enzyme family)